MSPRLRSVASGPAVVGGLTVGAAAVLVGWRLLAAAREPVSPATGDLVALFYPLMRHAFGELAAGHLPLWNPYQSCGEPLLANPSIGFFYPLYLPFLVLDTARAIDLDALLHLAVGGLGMAWLCRHLHLRWPAAVVAGVVYALHGSMLIKLAYPGFLAAVAWIPLIFLFVDRLLTRPTRRDAAALAAILGVSLLGGNLQFTYFTAWALVPLATVRTWSQFRRRRWALVARAFALLAVASGLALGLALVRLVPGAELMQQTWRAPGSLSLQQAATMAIPWRLFLVGLVSPPASAHAGPLVAHAYAVAYVGIVSLGLAFSGTVLWRRRLTAAAIASAGTAAALYAFGTGGPLYELVFALPGGSWFRAPERSLVIFGFAVAVLAGAGFDALMDGATSSGRGARTAVGALALGGVAVLAAAVGDPGSRRLALSFAALAALTLVARPLLRARIAAAATSGALALLVLVDLATAQRPFGLMPSRLEAYLTRNDDLFAAIRARQGLDRTYIWASPDPDHPLYFFSDVAEGGLFHHVWMATGYAGGIAGRRLERYMAELGPRAFVPLGYLAFRLDEANRPLLDLMGVRFLLIDDGREAEQLSPSVAASLRPLWRQSGVVLYENPRAMPRAFVADELRVVTDEDALLYELPRADLRRLAFVEEPIALPPPDADASGNAEQVEITDYTAERVSIDVVTPRPGLLVLTDQYYPGWYAAVDGAPVPIYRADYLFRGVPVPAGRHRVEFVYRPASVALGAAGSITALLAIAWLGFAAPRPPRRGP